MTNPELKEMLQDCAREIGGGLLESAVLNATTPEQLSNQILTLQFAAVHILAVCAFNAEAFDSIMGEDRIDEFREDIIEELELMRNEGMTPIWISGKDH